MGEARPLDHAAIVLRFSRALVAGDFEAAHALLTRPLAGSHSPETLRALFEEMISYGDGPADHAEIIATLTEWPDRDPDDAGWAYAAITGPGFSEAVAGVVTSKGLIRRLEWGRPYYRGAVRGQGQVTSRGESRSTHGKVW